MSGSGDETHMPEMSFEDYVEQWFVDEFGAEHVHRQLYLPEPRWYCDLIVDRPFATFYIELESRASEIRNGTAQAQGYAGTDPNGVPMVIVPKGHIEERKIEPLRRSSSVVIREFDEDQMEFV